MEKRLTEPQILSKIRQLRERLTDSDDHESFIDWERRAKKALILISLQKHEGIQMLVDKAKDEIVYRYSILRTQKPTDLSPEGTMKFANEMSFHHMNIDLWYWFIQLFVEADTDLKDIEFQLLQQDQPIDEEMKGTLSHLEE